MLQQVICITVSKWGGWNEQLLLDTNTSAGIDWTLFTAPKYSVYYAVFIMHFWQCDNLVIWFS